MSLIRSIVVKVLNFVFLFWEIGSMEVERLHFLVP